MSVADTQSSNLKFGWNFPTPTASLEFVVDLATPVPISGLVALISVPEGASVTSEAWSFSKVLTGHYRYIELESPGCLTLPVIDFDREISRVTISIVPWGNKQLVPETAVAGVWSIGAFNKAGTPGLSAISKGKLLTNE